MNFNDVAIVFIKGNNYKIHFWNMSKDNAINKMKHSDLNETGGFLYNFFLFSNINDWVIKLLIIKKKQQQLQKENREKLLNRGAKEYWKYEKNTEKLSKEEKNIENYPMKKKI